METEKQKRRRVIEDFVAWALLIGIILFSVLRTTQTNIKLEQTQKDIVLQSDCTQQFLGETVLALSENSKYQTQQAEANAKLQKVQLSFIQTIVSPDPVKQAEFDERLQEYFLALQEYNRIVKVRAKKAEEFPYPTVDQYRACLSGENPPPDNPPKPSGSPSASQTG